MLPKGIHTRVPAVSGDAMRLGASKTGRLVRLSAGRGTFVRSGALRVFRPPTAAAVALKAVPRDVAESPNATWVHLTTRGTWKGHPQGEFTFDDSVFRTLIANFERTKTPVPFKYEHPSQMGGEPVPSAGKIYDLKVNDSGLWAFTLFTDRAAKYIRAREYEYCSVVVDFESVDRASGEDVGPELFEVGLTDNPFIDGQHPIRLPAESKAA